MICTTTLQLQHAFSPAWPNGSKMFFSTLLVRKILVGYRRYCHPVLRYCTLAQVSSGKGFWSTLSLDLYWVFKSHLNPDTCDFGSNMVTNMSVLIIWEWPIHSKHCYLSLHRTPCNTDGTVGHKSQQWRVWCETIPVTVAVTIHSECPIESPFCRTPFWYSYRFFITWETDV